VYKNHGNCEGKWEEIAKDFSGDWFKINPI
jgi:hypothetical protein